MSSKDSICFCVGQSQNDTDTDQLGHSEENSNPDAQPETDIGESVIQLDLIQDTDGESLKPEPAEGAERNPLHLEEDSTQREEKLLDPENGKCAILVGSVLAGAVTCEW